MIDFIENRKEVPFLKKIKINVDFSIKKIEEFKMILINANLFQRLKTLEFKDLEFSFKDNGALISFIEKELFLNPPLLSTNVSYIKIPKETELLQVYEFCKLQTDHTCIIEKELIDPAAEL